MIKRYKHPKNKRHKRVRAKIKGTSLVPRLSVFRSNRYIYAQLINDEKQETLLEVSEKKLEKNSQKQNKTQRAKIVGQILARKALEKNIKKVVFDRGGYKYHGRVKAVAVGAREGGLKF